MNACLALLENVHFHPTFPMVVGVLQTEGLLVDSGNAYEDGLVLLHCVQGDPSLDEEALSVTLELCGGLGVPVLHTRDREYALRFRSVFPIDGRGKGRLAIRSNVDRTRHADLEAFYVRFVENPDFDHLVALESRLFSRDRVSRKWVNHEDSADFADALEAIEGIRDELEPIL